MSPLPRRMLGRATSWENPQVHLYPLPEGLTYVDVAVTIRPFVGSPHQIFNSPASLRRTWGRNHGVHCGRDTTPSHSGYNELRSR